MPEAWDLLSCSSGLRVNDDGRLFGELAHEPGDVRQAPVAGELPVGDAEDLGALGRDVAARGRDTLVLAVVRSGEGGAQEDAIALRDQVLECDVHVRERLEVAEA